MIAARRSAAVRAPMALSRNQGSLRAAFFFVAHGAWSRDLKRLSNSCATPIAEDGFWPQRRSR